MESKNKNSIRSVTNQIIWQLEQKAQDGRPDTAILAELRNSAGRSIQEARGTWPLLFESIPESFLSNNGYPTYEENAILVTLQLYSIGVQGSAGNVKSDQTFKSNMGRSLSAGRKDEDSKPLDRRFNAMVSSADFPEFTYYLRQLFKLVKSKGSMTVNYGKLADDLYRYQRGGKDKICFQWAESYYGYYSTKENNEEVMHKENEEVHNA